MATLSDADIFYPESDGKPMADNTLQWQWMVTIKNNISAMIAGPKAFVAGDLFWYPVEGEPGIVRAPDVMVALGRPQKHRGSYQQWKEDGVAPQVVFEILSHSNVASDVDDMVEYYSTHDVQEFYVYDPQRQTLRGWTRSEDSLEPVDEMHGWISPLLDIRFEMTDELAIFRPSGERFLTFEEIEGDLKDARERAEHEHGRAEHERKLAERERKRADQEKQRAEQQQLRAEQSIAQSQQMREFLRRQGFDPDNLGG